MGRRLAAAFAAVVLLAVVLLGGLAWRTTGREIARLAATRHLTGAQNVAALLATAYSTAGFWRRADLYPAQRVAARNGALLTVLDSAGKQVSGSGRSAATLERDLRARVGSRFEAPLVEPVRAAGRQVGTAELRFRTGTPAAERRVRRGVERTLLFGGALAAVLAAVIGVAVAGRITRPLRRLTDAARAQAGGDRTARAGGASEPAELGELGRAFDGMAETIEREDELRRSFAADVAHELRTPLAIAQGELEALIDGIAEPSPERLRSLHEEMLRLGRVVEDVETLAAAEAARFRLERLPLDLAEVVSETVEQLRAQADGAHLELTARLQPAIVEADRTRVEQIVRNLVGNSLKFTPAGGSVTVSVKAEAGEARLIIEDTGPGLADDELPHVFERFWRGHSGRTAPGSGVGLAVAAELARAHGGTIEAGNRPGGGAHFTVTFPRG